MTNNCAKGGAPFRTIPEPVIMPTHNSYLSFGRKTPDSSEGCKPASNLILILSYGTKHDIVLKRGKAQLKITGIGFPNFNRRDKYRPRNCNGDAISRFELEGIAKKINRI